MQQHPEPPPGPGEWYRANDGWYYCWPNPTPYREVPAGGDLPRLPWGTPQPRPARSSRRAIVVAALSVLGIGGLALVVVNTKTAPHGCAQAEQAAVRADDLITGFRQQTVTSADAASAFARISRDLDDVASIADDAALATHARSASASAARLRVMLVEGTGDITGDYDEFVADLRAIVAICKAA